MKRHMIEFLACALVLSALVACGDDGAAPTPGIDAGGSDAAMRDAGVLDAQVDLGPPPRFTDLGNGVVRDNNGSGLFWQQVVSSSMHTHPQAIDYCASLALDGRGWRLPSRDELMSITDAVRRNPAIHPRFFPGTPPGVRIQSVGAIP